MKRTPLLIILKWDSDGKKNEDPDTSTMQYSTMRYHSPTEPRFQLHDDTPLTHIDDIRNSPQALRTWITNAKMLTHKADTVVHAMRAHPAHIDTPIRYIKHANDISGNVPFGPVALWLFVGAASVDEVPSEGWTWRISKPMTKCQSVWDRARPSHVSMQSEM